jgi:hypothetical protein
MDYHAPLGHAVGVVWYLGWAVISGGVTLLLLGGFVKTMLSGRGRLERYAVWAALHSGDREDEPLVAPGEEPTRSDKFRGVLGHIVCTVGFGLATWFVLKDAL